MISTAVDHYERCHLSSSTIESIVCSKKNKLLLALIKQSGEKSSFLSKRHSAIHFKILKIPSYSSNVVHPLDMISLIETMLSHFIQQMGILYMCTSATIKSLIISYPQWIVTPNTLLILRIIAQITTLQGAQTLWMLRYRLEHFLRCILLGNHQQALVNPVRLEMVSNVTNKALCCNYGCNIVPKKVQSPVMPPSVIDAVRDVNI